ncbi:hypothetical protein B7072_19670 [Salmonella enterica subsp. enterica serovar Typhimurium]|nr:hypothetical protein [Salmonella enterica subsp. enterica serovar Typhimurium]
MYFPHASLPVAISNKDIFSLDVQIPDWHGQTCQSGLWQGIKFSFKIGGTFQVWPGQTVNLGRFKLCINTYRIDGRELAITELIPTDGPDENGYMNWRATNATQYSPYYMGIHCFI